MGVELLLDGLLARDRDARAAYLGCLEGAESAGAPFVWADALSAQRWRTQIVRLRRSTILDDYRRPDFVVERLVGALARRPRLALGAGDVEALRGFLPALAGRVEAALPALVGPVTTGAGAGLAPDGPAASRDLAV